MAELDMSLVADLLKRIKASGDPNDQGQASIELGSMAPRLAEAITSLRDALERTNAHIQSMQRDVLAYLPPDSSMTESDLVGRLIERLDGPEQREIKAIVAKALGISGE